MQSELDHICGSPSKLQIGRRRFAVAFLVLLAFGCFCTFIGSQPREPRYQAKTLRYWLKGYDQQNESTPEKADEAVINLGTNVIPTLLTMLRARDSAWDMKLHTWGYAWKQFAQKHHLTKDAAIPRLPSWDVLEAQRAFGALGPEARYAVPGLIKLLEDDPPSMSKQAIATVLGQIGPSAKGVIVVLLHIAPDPDEGVRYRALLALGDIDSEPELTVPAMIRGLSDESPLVVRAAALGLKAFGPKAKAAAPALIDALKRWEAAEARWFAAIAASDPNLSFPVFDGPSDVLKDALKTIDPEAAASVGAN